jgi:hypothetical protein
MTEEEKKRLAHLESIVELTKSGYAGIDKNGTIVDRRIVKDAIPIQENRLFGTPKPKKITED